MRKVRIRTIQGFCCANLGSELLRNNPRIAHANLGFTRNLLGSRSQTSAICGNKPTIDRTRKAAFCCANLGSARNLLGSRNQTSAIRGNKPTIDRACKAARPSASTKPRSIAHAKQLDHPLQRTHVAAAQMAELFCVRDRSWVCCRRWPRFGCAILDDCVRIRGLRSKIRGSEVCATNPRFACVILGLLRKARIRGLRSKILGWSESVLCA